MKKLTINMFKILFLSGMLFLFVAATNTSNAYATEVTVTLPTFDVRVNSVEIDNKNREYPLIVNHVHVVAVKNTRNAVG